MSQDNLEAELVTTQAETEAQDIESAQQQDVLDQINSLRDETSGLLEDVKIDFSSQLEEAREGIADEIDEMQKSIYQPYWSVSQKVILAATNVIRPESTIMNIAATVGGGAVTMTSNPTIADGINGQILILRGSHATDTITLTDGNGMQLNGNITLGLNDTITLYYDGFIANDWIEITRSDNLGLLTSGTYTPTRSAETNLDSNVTMTQAQYLRVGETVTVSGRFTADPTSGAATSFEITLPIASDIGAIEDVAGVAFCGGIAGQGAEVIGVVANNTAKIQWVAVDTTSKVWSFHFSYQVI